MQMDVGVKVDSGGGEGSTKRGRKREATDSNLSDSERFRRLEKRLRRLNFRNANDNSHLYTPVSNEPTGTATDGLSHANHMQDNVSMQVDDTRDRVYIHDLDKELEDVESDDGRERLVFLPDIEKHFSKLPHQVLAGGGPEGSRELVLYSVPKSLSVDESHDSVRKAIAEHRQRAREKALEEERQVGGTDGSDNASTRITTGSLPSPCSFNVEAQADNDPDAMDIG